ncbi:MAG: aminomethyl-transferring glycine dehydrogenase [Planctomycetota bacterium]
MKPTDPAVRRHEFQARHLGVGIDEMLSRLKVESLDELTDQVVPAAIRSTRAAVQPGHPEDEALARLRELASQNTVYKSYIGMGYYRCHTPSVILRGVLQNPAWYTAYTPYQPEISQGRLEALLNFQTMISDLTGLEVANASLLDEATAAAEAMAMCLRLCKHDNRRFFVSEDVHPQTIAVLRTRAEPIGVEIVVGNHETSSLDCFGALFQYPGTSGELHDFRAAIEAVHDAKGLVVLATDLLSLTLLTSPGELEADIAIGSSQRFGVPLFYGGPHAAFLSTRSEFKRAIPGRLIGVSIDAHGQTAYRMALQTREQHIRRDKATSNICTAQALLAITAGLYAVYHGPQGLQQIARRVHGFTSVLAKGLNQLGYRVTNERWFDTLTIHTPGEAEAIHQQAAAHRLNLRPIDADHVGISLDETTSPDDVNELLACFAQHQAPPEFVDLQSLVTTEIDAAFVRRSEYLTHPVFHRYRTETEMMRYLRRLADRDLALDRTMIPLGSCTMKLNAATEMTPVTWPEFADIHPYAPRAQASGYEQLIHELEEMLCAATGYDSVSLQPNAGSQGEFAGLLAISGYHQSRGEAHRNICLIPASAHGTNPASAIMAGMKVVVVKCDDEGNVDITDLQQKAQEHGPHLAAMMITYPSTHGVFEQHISMLCAIIHEHGGQVYIDGANLNAQVGLCEPGHYGGDVSHLNLHKTFCIPHGGGGPGVGPVAVRSHLAPFLPGDPLRHTDTPIGPVSAAPWGSAGILPISWAYIYMMGDQGLKKASQVAILNANYVATRLADHYPILYTGDHGRVAHECILDVRGLKVSVDDIAKRLVDYGFHAPTMSFPVPGTLMIEPTESESKDELDRFCDAMIQIRDEIQCVEDGMWDAEDNPLRHAPHTAASVTADNWTHAYSRQVAAFPLPELASHKYWPPVGRIDQAYGDRNVMCSCPTPQATQLEETNV